MTDAKVVHPATQKRIDFHNHILHGPTDLLSEDLPELFKQRCSLLRRWRIVWPPLAPKAEYAPILKSQESKALFFSQIHHPTLVLVDRNAWLRELLTWGQPGLERVEVRAGSKYGAPPSKVAESLQTFQAKLGGLLVELDRRL